MEVILKHQIGFFDCMSEMRMLEEDEDLLCRVCLFCNNCGSYMRTCKINHSSSIYCNCREDIIDMCLENAFHWHRLGMEEVFFEIEKQDIESVEDPIEIRERQNVFDYMLREEEMRSTKPPKYIEDMIIGDFISNGNRCPISMEDLTSENACMTSCYHVFDKNMVTDWVIKNKTCPTCRKECVVWGSASV